MRKILYLKAKLNPARGVRRSSAAVTLRGGAKNTRSVSGRRDQCQPIFFDAMFESELSVPLASTAVTLKK